jgi:glycosyltransferase involved in cell wall biosynthesis
MHTLGDLKIALVHDELTRRGGAEVVFEELLKIFPTADVYALYAGRPQITINGITRPIHTTFLQKWPAWWRVHPSRLLPFLPYAAEQLDFAKYDVVISSASAFAKGIVTRSNVPHICYCHTPTRYLWDATHELLDRVSWIAKWPTRLLLHYLRLVDFAAAQRVDVFWANSRYTQQRIAAYYRRSSSVIYPPIDTAFFTPGILSNRIDNDRRPFLMVGRLTPSKYFEQAILVCKKLKLPLTIIGQGPLEHHLKHIAGPRTQFIPRASREELRTAYRNARAYIQIAREDFGMATAEALACGTPVIAFGEGGVEEIVTNGVHGILYNEQRSEALAEAIRQFLLKEQLFTPEKLQAQASRFNTQRFHEDITGQLTKVLSHWRPLPKPVH